MVYVLIWYVITSDYFFKIGHCKSNVSGRFKQRWICGLIFQKVEVQAPEGETVGYVRQAWSVCKPSFKICDANDETVLRIEGPCLTCSICGDVEFQVG